MKKTSRPKKEPQPPSEALIQLFTGPKVNGPRRLQGYSGSRDGLKWRERDGNKTA
jgi:hypothetical protein